METFTEEKLLADLIARYAHLNDNNAKALEVYARIIASYNKIKK